MDFNLSEEQKQLKSTIINFARNELNQGLEERERLGRFPSELWKKCAALNLLALPFEEEYGGCGFSFFNTVLAIEALAYGCKDAGLVHALGSTLISGLLIKIFGTENQKKNILPKLCRGELIAAQAITEPEAGSDVMSIQTRAIKAENNYLLDGRKMFISNAPIADVFLVLAITNPDRKSFAAHSFLLCEKFRPGVSLGKPLEKLGLRTLQNSEVIFDHCEIPLENLIGQEGQGMFIFNEMMEWERILFAACHLGTLTRILEMCLKYATERKQFGQPISKFQYISGKIARMKIAEELIRTYLYRLAIAKDQNQRLTLEASVLKVYASENLKTACFEALQLHGGYGFMLEYEIQRDLRDSLASTIYSGTSEINLQIISKLLRL